MTNNIDSATSDFMKFSRIWCGARSRRRRRSSYAEGNINIRQTIPARHG